MKAVMLTVVHAARDYSGLVPLARAPIDALLPLEDRFADALLTRVGKSGEITCMVAQQPRAFIDLNRQEDDLDPAMVAYAPRGRMSARARHGLGLIPSRLPDVGALWRRPLDKAELAERLAYYRRFHAAVGAELRSARALHGIAVLLDIHSMPPLPAAPSVDVVIGDRFGQSAGAGIVDMVTDLLRTAGLRVALNKPYAGGAVILNAGHPASDIHALQLEFSRALYLDETLRELGPGFPRLQRLIGELADRLAATLPTASTAVAAE